MFDSPDVTPTHRVMFRVIREYWQHNKEDLQYDTLLAHLEQAAASAEETTTLLHEAKLLDDLELGNNAQSVLVKALHRHVVGNLLVQSHRELVADGGFDTSALAEKLLAVSRVEDDKDSLTLFHPDQVEELLDFEDDGVSYSTGLPAVDGLLEGGVKSGELALFLGEVGLGKTQALTHIECAGLRDGHPTIFFTGEISRARSYIRAYQNLLDKDRFWVMAHPHETSKLLGEMDLPPWSIVDFSSFPYTPSRIRRDVLRFTEHLEQPPLILVDYVDKVSPSDSQLRERFALADVTERLRRLAVEVGGAVWSASQVNRGAYDKKHVVKGDVAEAVAKVEIADVLVSLNQTEEERGFGQMRWRLLKARERNLPASPEANLISLPRTQSFRDDADSLGARFKDWSGNGS
jgi:hypothetical protein